MTLVVDSSVVVAALVDRGPLGLWAEALLMGEHLAAPHLMPAEVANVLRRAARAAEISTDVASLAHDDLRSLRVELFPYSVCADRVWELRSTVTAYDGWYVALAEALDTTLATLDEKLSRASGPRCKFAVPQG
jgi:predicted nucleic acid-binding protein